MLKDAQANPLAGATPAARDLFDEAADAFATYRGDPAAILDNAIAVAPGFPMAHLLKAWLFALATEPAAAAIAREVLDRAPTDGLDPRSAGHRAALEAFLAGEWTRAANLLAAHSLAFPRDLAALQAGHLIDYLRADARSLRDRIARALPAWEGAPRRSLVLGMYAFGLEEAWDHARAEHVGREAVDTDPRDCWAHHAVAHVLEMQGRADDGIAWITSREPHWAGEDNFFKVHNWWHLALCHIERDEPARALALFDGPVRAGPGSSALDLVDASALLWRLDLMSIDTGDRFAALSRAWEGVADGRYSPFNDFHAAMAHCGAGRLDEVQRLLAAMARPESTETGRWIAATGRPLIEGLLAFRRGRYAQAAELLWSGRAIVNAFGGSHAQRDVIDWTLTEAAIRGGLSGMSAALCAERLALRPHSPVNHAFRTRARALSAKAA